MTKIKELTFEEEEALRKGTLKASDVALELQEELEQDEIQVLNHEKPLSSEGQIQAVIIKYVASMQCH